MYNVLGDARDVLLGQVRGGESIPTSLNNFRKFFVPVIAIRNISNAAAAATSKAPSVSNLTITCTGITMAALPN